MAERRRGTIPQRVRLTQQTTDRIDDYQSKHQIPSFSAAVETLVRIGLDQSPAEILTPIIVSTVRRELTVGIERVIRLLLYNIVETGTASRLAGAAVYHLYNMDDPQGGAHEYDLVKAEVRIDALRTLRRAKISAVIHELLAVERPQGEE